mmetsp:Transcript_1767/g.3941  ORF Transcript_1767/g.3941 Transcript_1767/m.3941 type:complete len:274 (+) Transcript_1767:1311-2132(+)
MLLEDVAAVGCLLQHLQFSLCCLAVVQLVVAAGLQVYSGDGIRVVGKVGLQNLQGNIIIVKLVVAEGDIHIQGPVLPLLHKQTLVYVGGLLEVTPQVLYGRQAELILPGVAEGLVLCHHGALVVPLVRRVEEDPRSQRRLRRLLGLILSLLVLGEGIQAARLVCVDVLIILLLNSFVVGVDGLLVVAVVEVAVCEPHQEVRPLFPRFLLKLEQSDGANIVAIVEKLLQVGLGSLRLLSRCDLWRDSPFLLLLCQGRAWANHPSKEVAMRPPSK